MSVFPLATTPLVTAFPPSPLNAAFVDLIVTPAAHGQYLLEIIAYRGGEARSGGLAGLAEIPLASTPPGSGVSTGQITLLFADQHWIGEPSDADKPNTFYEGRMTVPLVLERQMPLLPEEERRVQRQFGLIEIANGDGYMDNLVQSLAVDGRQARVLFGPHMGAYADFTVIADVVATGWEADDLAVQIGLRDRSYNLDLPLQINLYDGTGGAEGNDEIEGKPKPLLYGRCRNVTPILIDPANLIYQVHDGAFHALDAVYDRGAALTDSEDDAADFAALVLLSVSAGEFATCLAGGYFKLGSSPDGLVTADVRGDADPDYADTLDVIALRLLTDRAGLANRYINTASFAGAAALGGEMGIYFSSGELPTAAEALNSLLGSVGGWWGAARDGKVRAGRLTAPELRSPNMYLNQFDILDLSPEPAPVPRWRQKVGGQKNWTVQRGEDIAASVTDERRQFLAEEYRVAVSASNTIRVRHLQALDADPLPGLFEDIDDAQALAVDLLALFSPDRKIYRLTLKRQGYALDLQKVVRITWPRLGLQNGKNFAVIGIREDADKDETQILCWG